MKPCISWLSACMACIALADEPQTHRFDPGGVYQPAGWPGLPPKLVVLAERPLRLEFHGLAADWKPTVRAHRITSARRLLLQAPEAEASTDGWQWTWTPPAASGPALYEIRFEGTPLRIVRVETRDPAWLKTTMEALCKVTWNARGLSAEERAGLTNHGLQLGLAAALERNEVASLEMLPRHGESTRRRVVWDDRDEHLVIWRPGPAAGDLEIRAPRWWISPEALATDQGLIRIIDLFSEPPVNP